MENDKLVWLSDVERWILTESACIDTPADRDAVVERMRYAISAVDAVEVVHAYWVNGHESRWQNVSDTYTCSVCGELATKAFGTSVKSRYCPWCGARMDGQRREDGDA